MASRTDIVDAVKDYIREIQVGNSVTVRGTSYAYQTDIGTSLKTWQLEADEKNIKFRIRVSDPVGRPVDSEAGEYGLGKRQIDIPIEVVGRGSTYRSTWMNKVLTDLHMCFEAARRLGIAGTLAVLTEDEKVIEKQEKDTTTNNMTLVVTYQPGVGES